MQITKKYLEGCRSEILRQVQEKEKPPRRLCRGENLERVREVIRFLEEKRGHHESKV